MPLQSTEVIHIVYLTEGNKGQYDNTWVLLNKHARTHAHARAHNANIGCMLPTFPLFWAINWPILILCKLVIPTSARLNIVKDCGVQGVLNLVLGSVAVHHHGDH